jgi:hypothetical protein
MGTGACLVDVMLLAVMWFHHTTGCAVNGFIRAKRPQQYEHWAQVRCCVATRTRPTWTVRPHMTRLYSFHAEFIQTFFICIIGLYSITVFLLLQLELVECPNNPSHTNGRRVVQIYPYIMILQVIKTQSSPTNRFRNDAIWWSDRTVLHLHNCSPAGDMSVLMRTRCGRNDGPSSASSIMQVLWHAMFHDTPSLVSFSTLATVLYHE